jgi:hypothetical protein
MTFALALVFVGLLMLYAGIKGKSLKLLLVGRSLEGSSGQIAGAP